MSTNDSISIASDTLLATSNPNTYNFDSNISDFLSGKKSIAPSLLNSYIPSEPLVGINSFMYNSTLNCYWNAMSGTCENIPNCSLITSKNDCNKYTRCNYNNSQCIPAPPTKNVTGSPWLYKMY